MEKIKVKVNMNRFFFMEERNINLVDNNMFNDKVNQSIEVSHFV